MYIEDLIPPLMFLGALVLIFTGYPVAFALGGTALIFAFIGIQLDLFSFALLQALPERIFFTMQNFTLLAVPFFIFMGTVLEKSGLAEDLLKTMGMLFGPLRGGLAISVVVVGTLLAAATGVVGATVVAMGLISLPVMLRYGYSKELASGIITASGTLGQVIPPSIVLIVLADQLGVSVGDLFFGSFIPGLLLSGMYILYTVYVAIVRPKAAPALPLEVRSVSGWRLAAQVMRVMVPPLFLILVVLGTIFWGWATPTEAGAFGALGAIFLAAVNRRLTLAALKEAMDATARLSSMVMMILVGSTAFSLVFRGVYGDVWVEDLLTNLPGGEIGFLIVANLVIFILGFFIDFFEIAFIVLPLLAPAASTLLAPMFGGDADLALVWFGVMVGMNLQTSFLTPPFGFSLFYLRGVAPPEVKTGHIYRGAIPFIVIQLVGLLLIILFPKLVIWLPQLRYGVVG
ncbi:TRAP transporter large permease [Marinithermus hydrothermalis]|uniref:TRAP dicarboxylate transporter, DctM subunit n=1 Tax=Marinithermus hydrothermalis (strain DSM 14884 / JCM 11576 / T1) TaxID=869210 RepID=F2NNN7_MARHT|nr:TRAP transporter large permease subunit [Marinithermus hydrothermalis]AEB11052.1 TRAP dicarboxylate transporter, DctM subunit [Marinithermus hydrothermalis DSM 14884]